MLLDVFRPYDYCSKTCGSLAAAAKNQRTGGPVICKVKPTPAYSLDKNRSQIRLLAM